MITLKTSVRGETLSWEMLGQNGKKETVNTMQRRGRNKGWTLGGKIIRKRKSMKKDDRKWEYKNKTTKGR